MTHVVNISTANSQFLSQWKVEKSIPLVKKDDPMRSQLNQNSLSLTKSLDEPQIKTSKCKNILGFIISQSSSQS